MVRVVFSAVLLVSAVLFHAVDPDLHTVERAGDVGGGLNGDRRRDRRAAGGLAILTPGEVGAEHVPPVPPVEDTVTFTVPVNVPALSCACTVMRCVPAVSGREVFTLPPET